MEQEFKSSNVYKKLIVALSGTLIPYKTEVSIRIQTTIIAAGFLLGGYLQISRVDWIFLIIGAAILLITECLNTAVEKLTDFVSPGYHALAGKVKDIAAGAVFFAGAAAFIISVLVFVPYLHK